MRYTLHINRTKRNSIFNLTNKKGNTLLLLTVGMLGYKGTRKKSSIIHYGAALEFAKKMQEKNFTKIKIYFNGKKNYRKSILNAFKNYRIKFERHIVDKTPIAYNGCKKRKKKK